MAKIIVIDDDEMVRTMVARVLIRAGHEVRQAEDGAQGLALFRAQPPDVVVTDILMPGKEGIETIRELRRVAPQARIIAMSGGGEGHNLGYLDFARHLGADEAIAKPFLPEELTAMIDRLIAGPKA